MAAVKLEIFNQCIDNINDKFEKLENNIGEFRKEISDLINSTKIEINSEVKKLLNELSEVNKIVQRFEDRLDSLERDRLSCHMTISGIPIMNNDSSDKHFSDICKVIGYDVAERVSTFRVLRRKTTTYVNKKTVNAPPIIVKFGDNSQKSSFFAKYKQFQNLNLLNIGINLDKRIYCNDGLTKKNSSILNRAKKLQHSKEIIKAFTRGGLVHIISKENDCPVLVKNIKQLDKYETVSIDVTHSSVNTMSSTSDELKITVNQINSNNTSDIKRITRSVKGSVSQC